MIKKNCIRRICDILVKNRSYDHAWILLRDNHGKILEQAETGTHRQLSEKEQADSRPVSAYLEEFLKKQISPAVNPSGLETCKAERLSEFTERNILYIPISNNNKQYGILAVSVSREAVLEDEKKLLEAVVTNLALWLNKQNLQTVLSKQETCIRNIMETTQEGIWDWDLRGDKGYVNPAYFTMLGYTPFEFAPTFQTWQELLHPEDKASLREAMEELKRKPGKTVHQTFRLKHKSGEWRWITSRCRMTETDNEGQPVRVIGASTDMTESKRAEEKIRQSEQQYRELVETVNEGIWVIDKEAYTTFVNPHMAKMLGYRVEEMIGKHIFSFMDEKGVETAMQKILLREQGIREQHDLEFIKKDGSRFFAVVGTSSNYDADGNYTGVLAGVTDITQHKLTQAALKESEQKFRALFENTTDGILLIYPETKRIYLVNKMFCRMLGYSLNEMFSLTAWDLHPPEAWPMLGEHYQKQSLPSGKQLKNIPIQKKDKNIFFADVNSELITLNSTTHFMGVFRDVTERHLAEQILRAERDRAQNYLDLAGVMFIAINADQKVSLINRKGCELLECQEEDVIGKNWFDNFIPEEKREEIKGVFNKLLAGKIKTAEYWENEVLTRTGKRRLIAWNNTYSRDNQGKIIATLGSGEDITERKQAEKALLHSEEQKQLALEGADLGLWDWNLQTGEVFISRQWAEKMGHENSEEMPCLKNWKICVHPEDRKRVWNIMKKHFQQKIPRFEAEYRMLTKTGEWKWVLSRAKVVERKHKNRPLRVTGTHLDITEHNRLQKELVLVSEREQQQFGRQLHDGLGQDLTGIALISKVLEQKLREQSLPEAEIAVKIEKMLSDAVFQIRNLAHTLYPAGLESQGLAETLKKLTANIEAQFKLPCRFECEQLSFAVDNDMVLQLYYIAKEAIHNAVKHAQAEQIRVTLKTVEGEIRMTIEDDGIGISDTYTKKEGLGINIMHYRAGIINAALTINRNAGNGTSVVCSRSLLP